MARSSAQQFLEIEQIREGILVLKNKGLRGILMVSSQNFTLKSEDEQTAIIFQFQGFLNSLDFSCQMIVQSRKLNITGYLEKLKELEQKQDDELLRIQTAEYHNFIKNLVESGSIMTKNFFMVIPYYVGEEFTSETALGGQKPTLPELTEETFQNCKHQLWQRMEFIALGLKRCGLKTIPLTTPEIIELFWAMHHPEEAEIGFYPELPPEIVK